MTRDIQQKRTFGPLDTAFRTEIQLATCYSNPEPNRSMMLTTLAQQGSEVLNDPENLRTRVHQTENEMSALRTIQLIAGPLNPDETCNPTNLEKASILIDTIASDICQRIECRHHVPIFSAPDRIPLEHTRAAILTACGMQDAICTARRLRKLEPPMCCPSSEVLNDPENLRTRVHQTENEMSALRTIQLIAGPLNPDETCNPTNLEKASILIDTIASDICQRIECRHHVPIFSAPDRIPLEHTRAAILTACGMQDAICTARRLRKLEPPMCCPSMMQFRDEKNAARLLTAHTLLSSNKKFQTLKIKAARTRLQRQLTKKLPEPVAPTAASACADVCHSVTQTCLLDPGPAPHVHDHEPSTSISGQPQILCLTSTTPKRSTADLRDTVTNQLTHEAVVGDDNTGSFSRPPDLMTLRVSPPKRFLGLKHLLSKLRAVTPSPAPTLRAPALRPYSTNLTIPVIPHKRICNPSNRATQFPDRIFKPQLPSTYHNSYQAPPLWQPAYYLPGIPFRQLPTPPQPVPLPKPRSDLITDPVNIADHLNAYFASCYLPIPANSKPFSLLHLCKLLMVKCCLNHMTVVCKLRKMTRRSKFSPSKIDDDSYTWYLFEVGSRDRELNQLLSTLVDILQSVTDKCFESYEAMVAAQVRCCYGREAYPAQSFPKVRDGCRFGIKPRSDWSKVWTQHPIMTQY
ncbi:hypothetical protein CLF_102111 [Clonorchis sinensis]|uniref:Uncharacterized protein n=1 Tax=Clonorchis sinensis TaxID=79923 RepID=G7Y7B3_CLOSI|nr:hypothetical protein CLF_102111 [Clonorchis sinensis]